MADETPETASLAYVEGLEKNFRESSNKLRSQADVTAKALGGFATAALTGVGIAKFADVFPWPGGFTAWVYLVLMTISFGLMAAVTAFFTYRLWRLNRPLVMAPDPARIDKLEEDEKQLVNDVYKQFTVLNRVPSLRAHLARAHRLERIADRKAAEAAKRLRGRAALIVAEVRATQARAAMIVIRRRAARAIYGRWPIVAYIVFVAAVFGFGISADYLASERSDKIALAKSCGEAHAAGATNLPETCDDFVASETSDQVTLAKSCADAREAGATMLPVACDAYLPQSDEQGKPASTSPRQESAKALQDLAAAWVRCEAAADENGLGLESCDSIQRALQAALARPARIPKLVVCIELGGDRTTRRDVKLRYRRCAQGEQRVIWPSPGGGR